MAFESLVFCFTLLLSNHVNGAENTTVHLASRLTPPVGDECVSPADIPSDILKLVKLSLG